MAKKTQAKKPAAKMSGASATVRRATSGGKGGGMGGGMGGGYGGGMGCNHSAKSYGAK